MLGQASYPFSMIEAAFTFLLVVGVAYSMQGYVQDYIVEETVDIRADRIENAAEVLQHYPEGNLELDLRGSYEFQVSGSGFILKYGEVNEERDLWHLNYDSINGPSDFEQSSTLCLDKHDDSLYMEAGC